MKNPELITPVPAVNFLQNLTLSVPGKNNPPVLWTQGCSFRVFPEARGGPVELHSRLECSCFHAIFLFIALFFLPSVYRKTCKSSLRQNSAARVSRIRLLSPMDGLFLSS